jgi:hypothetical protein
MEFLIIEHVINMSEFQNFFGILRFFAAVRPSINTSVLGQRHAS